MFWGGFHSHLWRLCAQAAHLRFPISNIRFQVLWNSPPVVPSYWPQNTYIIHPIAHRPLFPSHLRSLTSFEPRMRGDSGNSGIRRTSHRRHPTPYNLPEPTERRAILRGGSSGTTLSPPSTGLASVTQGPLPQPSFSVLGAGNSTVCHRFSSPHARYTTLTPPPLLAGGQSGPTALVLEPDTTTTVHPSQVPGRIHPRRSHTVLRRRRTRNLSFSSHRPGFHEVGWGR